ncbi:MAG TPA: dTMP kinase [Gemmatimonadaceae bacterium]|nr:dTMP kinase [Gemmatimonadaceae bacterium]
MLIVLEGPEAVGKSTQMRRLVDWLRLEGHDVLAVREPGGTAVGDELRRIVLDPASHLSPRTEALLFMASRAELVEQVIRPALAKASMVLVDRFFLSTYAYQIAGRGLDAGDVRAANHFATGGLVPDLTLLMRLPLAESLRRLEARRAGPDRMEQSSHDFHARVTAAFDEFAGESWQGAHPECGRIVGIDATGSEDEVFARLSGAVRAAWPGSFPHRSAQTHESP